MTDHLDAVIATLPPPWNTDVESHSWETRFNNDLVEYFDHRPLPPRKWTDEVSDEDSDGNWWTVEEARKKTLAEFKFEVARYRKALAEWEDRRAKGNPILMRGYVPSGPPTVTVRVTLANGSRATIVGDGERWKVTEEWHGPSQAERL